MLKKFLFLLCVSATVCSGCSQQKEGNEKIAYTHNVYELTITATLLSNESVGNDWATRYTCNGTLVQRKTQFTLPIGTTETVEIEATVTEQDKYPESGTRTLAVSLCDGFESSALLTVEENKGRYKGNVATWEIVCTVTLIEQLP